MRRVYEITVRRENGMLMAHYQTTSCIAAMTTAHNIGSLFTYNVGLYSSVKQSPEINYLDPLMNPMF